MQNITEDEEVPPGPSSAPPRRFFSLPKELHTAPGARLRSLSDTAAHQRAKLPSFVFGRKSKPDPQPGISKEEMMSRACRIRVNIISAKNLRKSTRSSHPKVAALKLKVEQISKMSSQSLMSESRPGCESCLESFHLERIASSRLSCCSGSPSKIVRQQKQIRMGDAEEDGSVKINQSFTFDIKDPNYAVLSVHVVSRSRFGGEESLGVCSDVHILELLDRSADCQDGKPQWHDLYSKNGRRPMPGKILMDIVAGIAEPEHKISVFLGTWNVGNARPAKDLSSWLPVKNEHELLVVAAQECEYQPRQPFSDCGKDWTNSIKSCVGPRYKLICATSRSQIRLAAFVRDDAEKAISEIDSGSEATGVGHVVANKGAVSIAFKFWDTDLCFVNSHLAAHVGYCDIRNSNYREIVENLSVGYQGMDLLSKFHHVFWMGDLNYRLDFGKVEDKMMAPEKSIWQKVVDQINAKNFEELLEHDELRKQISAAKAFNGFKEGHIAFAPTFKVRRDALCSYNEKRLPAWCDRILCRSFQGCDVELISYFSTPEISTSDHKPVGATVSLTAFALPSTNLDNDGRKWHITITSLEAQGLRSSDINGYSDPYVSFGGANLVSEFHSKVKFRTLNPTWDPIKDIPRLVLNASSLRRLEHEYLMCHVLDYDYASANDTLGYGAIPLRGLVAAFKRNPDEIAPFKIELLHRGLPAGVLKGGMKLSWEKSLLKMKSSLTEGIMVRTLSFRKSFKRTFFVKEHYH